MAKTQKPCSVSKNRALNLAVDCYGGKLSGLAAALGVTGTAVTGIMRRGYVSDAHAILLEAYTGISRWLLLEPRVVAWVELALVSQGLKLDTTGCAPIGIPSMLQSAFTDAQSRAERERRAAV